MKLNRMLRAKRAGAGERMHARRGSNKIGVKEEKNKSDNEDRIQHPEDQKKKDSGRERRWGKTCTKGSGGTTGKREEKGGNNWRITIPNRRRYGAENWSSREIGNTTEARKKPGTSASKRGKNVERKKEGQWKALNLASAAERNHLGTRGAN